MMIQAFYTGVSGIKTNQTAIDVLSNNIANISTVGFKGSQAEFSTLFEEVLNTTDAHSSDSSLLGYGSRVSTTSMDTSTGVLMMSDRNTDLAIVENGWFGVVGDSGVENLYTRAGSFNFDADNTLVTPDGNYVLGTMGGNIDGDILTEIKPEVKLSNADGQGKLIFPKDLSYPLIPTTKSQFFGNIGREDTVMTMSSSAIDIQNDRNQIKLSFTMTKPQVLPGTQWDVVATAETLDGETIYDTKNAKVEFNDEGALTFTDLTTIDNNGSMVEIDLGNGFNGVTSISGTKTSASSKSNGSTFGELENYEINDKAEILATFSNGLQSSVGKIAIYHFRNDQGLERTSGTTFKQSLNSGKPTFFQNAKGENINGTAVMNYRLEGSNVEMSKGLTDLIILQRSFDANSKSISTADQMLQKALNMSG